MFEKQVRVWVTLILINKDNNILIWQRIGKHWYSSWGFPGGHLEFWEEIEVWILRELLEETWLQSNKITDLLINGITNDIFLKDEKHYITIYFTAKFLWNYFDVKITEPENFLEWKWVSWDDLKNFENLFLPIQNYIKKWFNPFKNNNL